MKLLICTNKLVQYLRTVLPILIFAIVSVGASSPIRIVSIGAPSPIRDEKSSVSQTTIFSYVTAQRDPNLSDEEKIKAAINAYFTTRYEGQKLLEQKDFSPVIDDETLDWVKKEKDKREIELYIASLFDLKYITYNYTLDYDTMEIKNNNAVVQLRESHEVVFETIAPEVSKLSNVQHTITLHNKNGAWVIYKDEYKDELSKQLVHMTKDNIKKQVDENYQKDLERKRASINSHKKRVSKSCQQPTCFGKSFLQWCSCSNLCR